jgi:predicted  nucleic acid-binding Zn-ribbon protein
LPELAALADCEKRAAAVRTQLVEAQTAVADLDAEQRSLESDIDTVRQRADRDQRRMAATGVPAKETAGLQHEVVSLARRQGILEDELLELMEAREAADAQVVVFRASLEVIDVERKTAESARDQVLGEIIDTEGKLQLERDELSPTLPADLIALYNKIRQSSGVGAAMLRHRRCEGCHLELAGNELSVVRATKPEIVLRCENCRRILVRTNESGL